MQQTHLAEYQNIQFPQNCRGIIDVTKPPYNLDNTGKTDCTAVLCKLLDELLQLQIEATEATMQHLLSIPEPNAVLAFENMKINGVVKGIIFPEKEPQVPALYFPNGEYLVTDTISYSLDKLQTYRPTQTARGYELNRRIVMIGQSRTGTVIRLQDNCKGFEFGNRRPVISYMRGERSNIAWCNYFENMTIDTGSGNPGAIGLVFYGNNSGAVRNVTIRSSDPEHRGAVGISLTKEINSGCCVRNVEIDGFDIGIEVTPTRNYMTFDTISLKNQQKYGIYIEQSIVSFHNLHYVGDMAAVFVAGALANVVITDAELLSPNGSLYPAIRIDLGCVFLRNLKTSGFKKAYSLYWGETTAPDGFIEEFSSHGVYSPFDGSGARSMNLPCPPFPDQEDLWNMQDWVCVNDFGAVGDGIADDTDAIQRAMNHGGTIWFQPGYYLLSDTVTIPPQVRHIHFMNCELAIPESRSTNENDAVFAIVGESDKPLLMEKLASRDMLYGVIRLISHESKRTLHLRDIHAHCCPVYVNRVSGGTVYMEDVVSTTANKKYRHQPAFHFIGQTVYAQNLNPERSMHEIINDGGLLWLMGFKTEGDGPLCETLNGGCSDILGGTISIGTNGLRPIIYNENSNVSAILATNGYGTLKIFPVAVEEMRNGSRRVILHNELPTRFDPFYRLPLYVGRAAQPRKTESYGQRFALY